jgi:hypothetical protein
MGCALREGSEEMASMWIGESIEAGMNGNLDFDGATWKEGLATTVYVPNQDDTFLDDGSADDFTSGEADLGGTGYTAGFGNSGRKTLSGVSSAYASGTNRYVFDANDAATWTAINPANAIAWAAVLNEVTNDTASRPAVALDFADVDPNGNDFTIQFHADGIGYIALS